MAKSLFTSGYIKKNYAVTGTTFQRFDVQLGPLYQDIDIVLRGLGHANQTLITMMDAISNVKLIANGGKVLKNLSGTEIRKLAILGNRNCQQDHYTSTTITEITYLHFPLIFGRTDKDLSQGLPTKDLDSLQIEITFDATALAKFTTAEYIDIMYHAYIGDYQSANVDILVESEYKAIVAGTTDVSEPLPRGGRYVGVMVFGTVLAGNESASVRLTVDGNNETIIDSQVLEIMADNKKDYKLDATSYNEMVTSTRQTLFAYMLNLAKMPIDSASTFDLTLTQTRPVSTTATIVTRTLERIGTTIPKPAVKIPINTVKRTKVPFKLY